VLETFCASCHDGDRAGGDGAAPSFGGPLSLDELAADPALVRPGLPDASPLYHVLLDGHGKPSTASAAKPPPEATAADAEAVRDWIEALPPLGEDCPHHVRQSDEETARLMQQWRRQFPASASDTRFLSLAHLSNVCLSPRALQRYRADAAESLSKLPAWPVAPSLDTVGDLSVLLAFRLSELGLTPEDWDRLAARAPRSSAGALPADWLAHEVDAGATSALARRYLDDVNLKRAAAEAGMSEAALSDRLGVIQGAEARIARQLRQWQVTRQDWERLAQQLLVTSGSLPAVADSGKLRLGLWSDKPAYAVGDLMTFSAISNRDCYLTIIAIDRDGYATVLFPNDFQHENMLRAGSPLSLPVKSEGFQFRATQIGKEMVAGICTEHDRRPEGIYHDFEGQRFTILGSWRAFLRQRAEREAEIVKLGPARGRRPRRDTLKSPANGSDAIARAAIVFKTE
jgi:hypothetical protein